MEQKCPECGAPIVNGGCSYCNYRVPQATQNINNTAYVQQPQAQNINNTSFVQRPQTQNVQPQFVQSQGYNGQPIMVNVGMVEKESKKSKTVALLLCIFLGWLGVHKFYVGKIGMGIIYFLTGGLFGIGWIIDIILIAVGSFKDEFDLPLK